MKLHEFCGSIAATSGDALTMLITPASVDLQDMTHHQMELEMLTL